MILDINQSAEEFWLAIKHLDSDIKYYASLSLIEPQDEKELFITRWRGMLTDLDWDSLRGGCYQLKQHSVVFNLDKNASLAQLLLSLGHAFFDGQLTYLGNQILSAISQLLCKQNSSMLLGELRYSPSAMPFNFTGKQLNQSLSATELQLLAALLSSEPFQDKQNYWINYNVSLAKAAQLTHIHFKQAQILEQELRCKLISLTNERYQLTSDSTEASGNALAQLLSTLTQAIIWHKGEEYASLAHELKGILFNKLFSASLIDKPGEAIAVCSALVDYAQIDYVPEHLALLANKLIENVNRQDFFKDGKTKILFFQSFIILKKLGYLQDKPIENLQLNLKKDINLEVIFLSGSKLETEPHRQKLLSCFDPGLKIYQKN